MDCLTKIVDYKALELAHLKRQNSLKDYELMARDAEPAHPLLGRFKEGETNIIAEVKKASPSAGLIREDFDPVEIARIYEEHGARAVSVLTDENFFQGHLSYLQDIKKTIKLPLLRKDFTLDEYHIFEGRAHGADAVLLIAALLDDHQIKDYHDLIAELGMTPLVEVHSQEETDRVLKYKIALLGINNRNLKTFIVDSKTTIEIMSRNSLEMPVIAESGITGRDLILEMENSNVAGFLVGESLMRSLNIGDKLKELQGA